MTPDERARVDELFQKLQTLESNPRDPEAERAITAGLGRAPHAIYPLVQTVLVQDEALKAADARIRELEAELGYDAEPQREGGFLDTMRDALFGREPSSPVRRGSVPSVGRDAPMGAPPVWRDARQQPQQPMAQEPQGGRGGSFLGTAAAGAAGVIGGYMLMNSLGGLFGGGQAHAQGHNAAGGDHSPWGGGRDASDSDLARQAGLDDMKDDRQSFFDDSASDFGDDMGGDFGGDGGGE